MRTTVFSIVLTIATAIEEQAATTGDISGASEVIQGMNRSASEVNGRAGELALLKNCGS